MQQQPIYDPLKSYAENYEQGPFGLFANPSSQTKVQTQKKTFLGQSLSIPFGIPAGPLLNANFVSAAFRMGFNLCVYKTVRSQSHPCHPWPNVLAVHPEGVLPAQPKAPLVADTHYTQPLSITNSFGVPSKDPEVWQPDMERAVKAAGEGQVLIGSFQGTTNPEGNVKKYVQDFVLTARLVKETGAKILEANLSCPNEGTSNLLCFDLDRTQRIVAAIKEEIGETPLILKTAYYQEQSQLEKLLEMVGGIVQGIASINTIAAEIRDQAGEPALPGEGRLRSGVCGDSIRWAGLEMSERLAALRTKHGYSFAIIGVGGVTQAEHYREYRERGADAVMSATGAMWNPTLAQEIAEAESIY